MDPPYFDFASSLLHPPDYQSVCLNPHEQKNILQDFESASKALERAELENPTEIPHFKSCEAHLNPFTPHQLRAQKATTLEFESSVLVAPEVFHLGAGCGDYFLTKANKQRWIHTEILRKYMDSLGPASPEDFFQKLDENQSRYLETILGKY